MEHPKIQGVEGPPKKPGLVSWRRLGASAVSAGIGVAAGIYVAWGPLAPESTLEMVAAAVLAFVGSALFGMLVTTMIFGRHPYMD